MKYIFLVLFFVALVEALSYFIQQRIDHSALSLAFSALFYAFYVDAAKEDRP